MYLLAIGVILLVLKYMAIGPFAAMAWWMALAPFGLAVAWWAWADASGYTKKKAMEREEGRRQARIEKNRENLGIASKKRR